MLNSLAAVNLLQDRGLFVPAVERYDDRNRPANSLLRGKAEKPLRAPVPAEDQAVEILRQDGVFGQLDNGLVVVSGEVLAAARRRARPM